METKVSTIKATMASCMILQTIIMKASSIRSTNKWSLTLRWDSIQMISKIISHQAVGLQSPIVLTTRILPTANSRIRSTKARLTSSITPKTFGIWESSSPANLTKIISIPIRVISKVLNTLSVTMRSSLNTTLQTWTSFRITRVAKGITWSHNLALTAPPTSTKDHSTPSSKGTTSTEIIHTLREIQIWIPRATPIIGR